MTRARIDRTVLAGECISLFRAAVKNPATRDPYERRLINFLNTIRMTPDEFAQEAQIDPIKVEKKVISFVSAENARCEKGEITAATVGNALKAIRLLLEMNDVSLNWKKIRRILPRARRYALDRTPTVGEIQEIIEATDLRGRALTLVLIASGIREGAVQYFKIRDYTRIEQEGNFIAGRLTVYNGDQERYVTFLTPEACNAIDKYLQFRTDHGETISFDSPLFRDKFDPIKGQYGHGKKDSENVVIPMTPPSVRQYYNRLLFSIGIRRQKKRRHDFSVHGFRKYFKTRAEQSGMKPINVELLMGHSVGISDSYYRPTENELLQDYLRATEALTISQEKKLRDQVENLKVENAEIDIMKKNYLDMKISLEGKDEQVARLTDTVAVLSDQYNILSDQIERMKK